MHFFCFLHYLMTGFDSLKQYLCTVKQKNRVRFLKTMEYSPAKIRKINKHTKRYDYATGI